MEWAAAETKSINVADMDDADRELSLKSIYCGGLPGQPAPVVLRAHAWDRRLGQRTESVEVMGTRRGALTCRREVDGSSWELEATA